MGNIEPEYGMRQVLRGYTGFEAIYQGRDASNSFIPLTPIPPDFNQPSSGLDPEAENLRQALRAAYQASGSYPVTAASSGISPGLIAGCPTPIGSLAKIYLPRLINAGETPFKYFYMFCWRIRSAEVGARGQAFHSPYDGPGAEDDGRSDIDIGSGVVKLTGAAKARKIIYAGAESTRYIQAEPVSPATVNRQNMYQTQYTAQAGAPLFSVYYPGIAQGEVMVGNLSQGIVKNPGQYATGPLFDIINMSAEGDELVVLLGRDSSGGLSANWDFDTTDKLISVYFGTGGAASVTQGVNLLNMGVVVLTGAAS